MTLDSFLADPALVLPAPLGPASQHQVRVRFRPSSEFARSFKIPPGAAGVVLGQWEEDGRAMANVALDGVDGVGFASGVPLDEVDLVSL